MSGELLDLGLQQSCRPFARMRVPGQYVRNALNFVYAVIFTQRPEVVHYSPWYALSPTLKAPIFT